MHSHEHIKFETNHEGEAVHPAMRPAEPDHPMALLAEPSEGDPALMLDCLVEEYAHLGYSGQEILQFFQNPFFQAAHGLREFFGEAELKRRIEEIIARCGIMYVSVNVLEESAQEMTAADEAPLHAGAPEENSACSACALLAQCGSAAVAEAPIRQGGERHA